MEPFLLEIERLIKKDYIILHKYLKNDTALYKIIESESPKKVFLISGDDIVNLKSIPLKNEITYQPCLKISITNTDISEIVTSFESYEFILVYDRQNTCIGYIHIGEMLKQLMNSHQRLQAFFQTILNTINESCIATDSDKKVTIWTRGAERIFSITKEEIIGKTITDYFSPERIELLNTLEKGTTLHHSQHQAREDLVVMINSSPVYLDEKIIGAVVSETDITSQVRLNNELYNTTEKLFNLEKETNKFMPVDPFQLIRGNSPKLKRTIDMAKKAATTNTNILIHGESGVGKELFAKAVHTIREGENAPFIAINCGAIPSALFESEIFGYEKGAFSGADQRGKKGKAELAQGGTLFLDEIGEMPLEMQVKILRLLQEKKFYSVGGTKEKEVEFSVVAATNRDLKKLVKEGKFREDLYYRLNVVSLEIPPLSKRPEDIIELTHYFLYEMSIKYNRPIHGISQAIMQALLQHDWPGNIRELKNVIERLVVFSESGEIKLDHLPFEVEGAPPSVSTMKFPNTEVDHRPLRERLQEIEREIILKELEKENGNKVSCAKNLQLSRATLYNRFKKLNINV